MNASEIISKKIYSISEGCEVGYVLNFSLSRNVLNLEKLFIVSLFEENEFVLNYKDIAVLTEDAVFINDSKCLIFDANLEVNNPIGKKIFSLDGKSLGKVIDVEIDKDKVKKIIGSSCEILPKNIYSLGNDCMFFSNNKRKKEIKIKNNKKNKEINVKIQNISLPFKEKDKSINFLNKIILRDVLDENHIVIFRKNQMITPKILVEARQKGLLKKLEENMG